MSASPLKDDIHAAMKAAMRAKDRARLQTIRLMQAEFGTGTGQAFTDRYADFSGNCMIS